MNPYALLKGILPDPVLQVGEVVAYNNGTATIELPDGGLDQARGEASIGDRVFFRDGLIEALAPTLTIEVIDI